MTEETPDIELLPPKLKKMLKQGKENPEKLWGKIAQDLNWFKS